ncbi:hypothetical protein ACFV1B_23005 [Streptomyces sp. NPDC059637]|uniref:hypothetical protein n=1 Tax=Streptomyces sp. NPDC059637 TaxID=3347752 RepID=UPI0036AA8CB3
MRIRGMGRSGRRAVRWTVLVLVALLVLPPAAGAAALRLAYRGDPSPQARTRGQDAVWLGHAWVDGRRDGTDLAALAERVRGTGVKDLYVHTGPLEFDGTLDRKLYPRAAWLVKAVHRELPGVRVQAWLGQVLSHNGSTGLRLPSGSARRNVARSAEQVLDAGFDGVHFDLEPMRSGDRHFLTLLDDVHRATSRRGAPLSVAAHQIDPLPGMHAVAGAFTGDETKWWSREYFGEVARRVDQVAVMSYDTWTPLESLYGGYVARQTELALEATPEDTDLLMGAPAFHSSDSLGHWESAETVAAAMRGVRLGLDRHDPERRRFGVALYVDFEATAEDWAAYRSGWGLKEPEGPAD